MRMLAIIFAVVILAINSVTLYFVLRPRESVVRYRVATSDINDRSGMLQIAEYTLRGIKAEDFDWVNVNAGLAARIAHMFVFEGETSLRQPYTVIYNDEHGIYIVLADIYSRDGVLRVLVCGRTGGVLEASIGQRASMPTYLPWP